jgi:hypothetical protein
MAMAGCSDPKVSTTDDHRTDESSDVSSNVQTKEPTDSPKETNTANGSAVLINKLANGYGFTMKVGDSKQMSVDISPKNATNKSVEWSVDDEAIATIDKGTGMITGKAPGTVKVYVKALDGSEVIDSCKVSVISGTGQWELNAKRKVTNKSLPYYLYFERDAYTISIYGQGDDGYYSKFIKTISSSRGRTINMTLTGFHKLEKQKRWYKFQIGVYWTQYCIRYSDDIYLHGPLYKEDKGNTMFINEYNQIGTASTSGCLAMRTEDIKWIWDNCPDGTTLEIASGNPVGFVAAPPQRIPEDGPAIDPSDPEFS